MLRQTSLDELGLSVGVCDRLTKYLTPLRVPGDQAKADHVTFGDVADHWEDLPQDLTESFEQFIGMHDYLAYRCAARRSQ